MKYSQYLEELERYPSIIFILLSSAIAVIFAIFFNISAMQILLLYWVESVIIGFFNVLKMLIVDWNNIAFVIMKIFLIPFFIVHYGMFMFVHLIFIVIMTNFKVGMSLEGILDNLGNSILMLIIPVLALLISHAYSFVQNFVLNGEYKNTSAQLLMIQPYSRVFLMQVVIIFGGWISILMMAFFKSVTMVTGMLILFIILKTVMDIKAHIKERKRYQIMN